MLIVRSIEIDMGHRITNHASKCANLHGHRYRFEVGVAAAVNTTGGSPAEGMVIDFDDLKKILLDVIDRELDHGLMLYRKDPVTAAFLTDPVLSKTKLILVDFIPTIENIVDDLFGKLAARFEALAIRLEFVKGWETPNCWAIRSRRELPDEGGPHGPEPL